jgi:NAD(P)-dependent dehydrogenase (short-subunit alcohol dehydrogenase family)
MADTLSGRTAVVFGASSGIGAAIALAFGREGARVVLAARRQPALERVAAAIAGAGGTPLVVPCDVSNEREIVDVFGTAVAAYGRVDVLVNSAGVTAHAPIDEMTLAYWNRVVAVNLTAAFLACREAVKVMKAQEPRGGRIINVGSVSAKAPRPDCLAYTATKFALHGLTHQLTLDGRAYGVVASVIHPGNTFTGFTGEREGPGAGATPADYLMNADDVARVAVLMATLPPEVNLFEATMLPNSMSSFLGRG